MTAIQTSPSKPPLKVRWEKLPDDFVLPDDPVDNNLQPLLAAALRESLELAGLILEASLIAQRKPSMTETIGLREYSNRHCSGTMLLLKPTGDIYKPNCTKNGTI